MNAPPQRALHNTLGPQAPRGLWHLFCVFTKMALQGFGGVLAVTHHTLVERQQWLTRAQYVEMLSISQVLPGPNVVNLSLVVGDRFFGWRGAAAALLGMLAVPLVVVLLLAAAYNGLAQHTAASGALRGMGAAAAGLVLGMALKLLPALRGNPNGNVVCALLALASAVAMAVLRWPMAYVVLGLGFTACALAWWRLSHKAAA